VSHHDAVVWYLRVEHQNTSTVSVLTVTGRISSLTAPELERALVSSADSPGALVLDLTGVDYISSAGLRAVAGAAAAMAAGGRPFVVGGMTDAVSVAFALAGLEGSVTIEPTRDDAVARATLRPRAGETAC
jgi:anti-sigma B factor antagonist